MDDQHVLSLLGTLISFATWSFVRPSAPNSLQPKIQDINPGLKTHSLAAEMATTNNQ